ncbi:2-amino-4-oxopentanoate thiolase subunit OrtA [Wukongibacter sp. M2B1]|uniref:2-amino-4-oxopentanoate thiolase subunit OrtA n=1 Tax=Wukongibacter sp. M2B1 TaxID=3088895 RepID=UPI003D7A3B4D
MNATKGDWVNVYNVVLKPTERAPQVPEDTKGVPLETWVKGFIEEDAEIGDTVNVKTMTGRTVTGKLVEVNPSYTHSFGNTIPEVFKIGLSLKEVLFGGEENE